MSSLIRMGLAAVTGSGGERRQQNFARSTSFSSINLSAVTHIQLRSEPPMTKRALSLETQTAPSLPLQVLCIFAGHPPPPVPVPTPIPGALTAKAQLISLAGLSVGIFRLHPALPSVDTVGIIKPGAARLAAHGVPGTALGKHQPLLTLEGKRDEGGGGEARGTVEAGVTVFTARAVRGR